MRSQSITLCILALASLTRAKIQYNGFQVLRTAVPNENQFEALKILMNQSEFDFWKLPSLSTPSEIMTSAQNLHKLTSFFAEIKLDFDVKVDDVQRLIEMSEPSAREARNESAFYDLTWDNYYKTDVILQYLEYLEKNYDFVSTEKIATTFEGRDVVAIRIAKAGENKKNVFIEGTAHGREWISPAVVTYLIKELVEHHEENARYLDKLNFHIVPVANPDGYDYCFDEDRLWRKTRTQEHSSDCPGVDLNRNYPFDFGGESTSSNPCSSVFRGSEALSEAESAAVAELFSGLDPVPELALLYHSAVDCFLYPYGHDHDEFPDNKEELIQLCEDAMAALNEVDGQDFFCMKATSLYPVGGSAMDWMASQGVRFAYTPELRDNGYSWLLPPEFILPSGQENWAALKVMMDKLLE